VIIVLPMIIIFFGFCISKEDSMKNEASFFCDKEREKKTGRKFVQLRKNYTNEVDWPFCAHVIYHLKRPNVDWPY
jgi:hypothetical protein